MTVDCAECGKPRVIYSQNKLSERQQITILTGLHEEYTCVGHVLPPDNPMHKSVEVKLTINCGDPIELAYYSSKIGREDVCCYCGGTGATQSNALKEKFKTVLPVCAACIKNGLQPITARPYGTKKK